MTTHAGRFTFDELEIISADGRIAYWTAYEGQAEVDGNGNVTEIKLLGKDRRTQDVGYYPIFREDGDIWVDIVRSLGITYADQIAEAVSELRVARRIREYDPAHG